MLRWLLSAFGLCNFKNFKQLLKYFLPCKTYRGVLSDNEWKSHISKRIYQTFLLGRIYIRLIKIIEGICLRKPGLRSIWHIYRFKWNLLTALIFLFEFKISIYFNKISIKSLTYYPNHWKCKNHICLVLVCL